MTVLIFDNTPLSHSARAGALSVLQSITAPFQCIAPDQVVQELIRGISLHPALAAAVSLPWVNIVELTEASEIVAFARYKTELGGGIEHNNGEAPVLAPVITLHIVQNLKMLLRLIEERAQLRDP